MSSWEHGADALSDSYAAHNGTANGTYEATIDSVAMDAVGRSKVKWLWYHRIAIGKITLVAGDPGLGKSFLTLDMAARVSAGRTFPDCSAVPVKAGSVLLLSGEDDPEDTIGPRLDAAGADCSKIELVRCVRQKTESDEFEQMFSLQTHVPALERKIEAMGACRMVIIDPVTVYLGDTDSHKNAEVRALMAPLKTMAERHGVSVVIVTHLRKSSDGPAVHKTIGSLAFAALARSVWGVCRDKEDESGERRLFVPIKNNLGNDKNGLAYSIVPWEQDKEQGRLEWENGVIDVSADEAMGGGGRDSPKSSEAMAWLKDLLVPGARDAKSIFERADAAGISEKTLKRAKKALGVESYQRAGGWEWELPGTKTPEQNGVSGIPY